MFGVVRTHEPLVAVVEDERGVTATMPVSFVFRLDDPLAVTMRVETRAQPVVWTFSAQLLDRARVRTSGAGAVKAWPTYSAGGHAQVTIRLTGETGAATVTVPRGPITDFMAKVKQIAPADVVQQAIDTELATWQ